jgi:hypothetical protein
MRRVLVWLLALTLWLVPFVVMAEGVVDLETGQVIPSVGPLFPDGTAGKIRVTFETRDGSLNRYYMHGNRNYYRLGLFGKRSWWGQDFQPWNAKANSEVLCPCSGLATGGTDPVGGPWVAVECDNGLWIRVLHLDGSFKGSRKMTKGDIIGQTYKLNGIVVGVHVTALWRDKDVPFSELLPDSIKIGKYGTRGAWVEGSTIDPNYFEWLMTGDEVVDEGASQPSSEWVSISTLKTPRPNPVIDYGISLLDAKGWRSLLFISVGLVAVWLIGPERIVLILKAFLIKARRSIRVKKGGLVWILGKGAGLAVSITLISSLLIATSLGVRAPDGVTILKMGKKLVVAILTSSMAPVMPLEIDTATKVWIEENGIGARQYMAAARAAAIVRDPKTGFPSDEGVRADVFSILAIMSLETSVGHGWETAITPQERGLHGAYDIPKALRARWGGGAKSRLDAWERIATQPSLLAKYGSDLPEKAKGSVAGDIGWTQAQPDNFYRLMKDMIEENHAGNLGVYADPWDPDTAAEFTARYLVRYGKGNARQGIKSYNPAHPWYTAVALQRANGYESSALSFQLR